MILETPPLYTIHERVWHWLQAALMILLISSGLAIHYPDRFGILGSMANAIRVHTWIWALLMLNAFLGAFYHLTAEKYHHFLPRMDDFTGAAVRQARFYPYGISKESATPWRWIRAVSSIPCRKSRIWHS